jgi:hypothetical protein
VEKKLAWLADKLVGEIADILCDFRCVGLSLVIAST